MYNWARSVKLGDITQVIKLASVHDISSLLQKTSRKIKVLGSGMSYLGIGKVTESSDLLLDLSGLNGLLDVSESTATFLSATTIGEVVDALTSHNLQLVCCPGVLLTQTIAGALATGTHGQGFANAGIYDAVVELQVVLADGSIKVYTAASGDDEFNAFRLHLGALGILTQITFRCEPLVAYKQVKQISSFPNLVRYFDDWNMESEHCKAWWFPETDHVQLWRTVRASEDESKIYHDNNCEVVNVDLKAVDDANSVKDENEFAKTLQSLVQKMDDDTKSNGVLLANENAPNVPGGRFETVLRFKSQEARVGNMYQLWCKAPQVNSELAIPMRRLPEALKCLHAFYNESHPEMHYPFILRATGTSTAWISPAKERVCYIGFLVYLSPDSFEGNGERLEHLANIESLLAKFEAVPHYGKFFTMKNYEFGTLMPKWNDFLELRKRVDPRGRFLNTYLEELLHIDQDDSQTHLSKL